MVLVLESVLMLVGLLLVAFIFDDAKTEPSYGSVLHWVNIVSTRNKEVDFEVFRPYSNHQQYIKYYDIDGSAFHEGLKDILSGVGADESVVLYFLSKRKRYVRFTKESVLTLDSVSKGVTFSEIDDVISGSTYKQLFIFVDSSPSINTYENLAFDDVATINYLRGVKSERIYVFFSGVSFLRKRNGKMLTSFYGEIEKALSGEADYNRDSFVSSGELFFHFYREEESLAKATVNVVSYSTTLSDKRNRVYTP